MEEGLQWPTVYPGHAQQKLSMLTLILCHHRCCESLPGFLPFLGLSSVT